MSIGGGSNVGVAVELRHSLATITKMHSRQCNNTTCALKDRDSKGKLFLAIFRSNDIMICARSFVEGVELNF